MITENKSNFNNTSIKMFMALFLEADFNSSELCWHGESFISKTIREVGFDESLIKSICSINLNSKNSTLSEDEFVENIYNKVQALSSYISGLRSLKNRDERVGRDNNYDFDKLRDCAKDFMLFDKNSVIYPIVSNENNPFHSNWYIDNIVRSSLRIMQMLNITNEESYSLFELSKVFDTKQQDLFRFIIQNSNSKYLFKDIYFSIKREKGYVDKKCEILKSISKRGIVVDEIVNHITETSHRRIKECIATNLLNYYKNNKNSDKDMSKVISTIRKFNSLEDYTFLKSVISILPKDELKWYVTAIAKYEWLQKDFDRVVNQ